MVVFIDAPVFCEIAQIGAGGCLSCNTYIHTYVRIHLDGKNLDFFVLQHQALLRLDLTLNIQGIPKLLQQPQKFSKFYFLRYLKKRYRQFRTKPQNTASFRLFQNETV